MINFKPISISLSPNIEKDDINLTINLLKKPIRWKSGIEIKKLENIFKKYLESQYAFSFNSGRSAFLAILESLEIEKESEVLIQSFTCNAAVNPIIWAGFKPVYVDVNEENFNIDIKDLIKKITSETRVIVIQHTFGIPAEIDKILKICKKYNLILIEDCAHSLGAKYKNKKIGTFGKAAFFSFSRDKIISSVYGGIAITNDKNLSKKIKGFQDSIKYPSYFWILQQIMHPIAMHYLILPIYGFFSLGKMILIFLQKIHLLSKAVHWKEKIGKKPDYFPKKMPNVLAILATNQFKKLEKFNIHRKKIAEIYYKELKNTGFALPIKTSGQVFLRFPIKHKRAHKIIKKAWANNLLLGDWYTSPIAPNDTKLSKVCYERKNKCKNSEKLSKITLNLPTHINITEEKAILISNFIKNYD